MKYLPLLGLMLSFFQLQAQNVGIGQWRSHLPYGELNSLAVSEKFTYFSTPYSLFRYDREYRTPLYIDKTKGLNDAGITLVAWHPRFEQALIAYTNGNLDIFDEKSEQVANAPAILNNSSIIGDKTIYDIYCDSIFAYLCCNFGLVALDMQDQVFRYTTFTPNRKVQSLSRWHDTLFMGTDKGIYAIPSNGSRNLLDFNNWTLQGRSVGLPPADYRVNGLGTFNEQLYALINDTLMRLDQGQWAHVPYRNPLDGQTYPFWVSPQRISKMRINDSRSLNFSTNGNAYYQFNNLGELHVYYLAQGNTRDFWVDNQGVPYLATNQGAWVLDPSGWYQVWPEGPLSITTSSMACDSKGQFWMTSDPVDYTSNFFSSNGIAHFTPENFSWKFYNLHQNLPTTFLNAFDFNCLTPMPKNRGMAFGSFLSGLYTLDAEGNWSHYYVRDGISSLGGAVGDTTRTRVTGLAYDEDENLWISNHIANQPISVLKKDGSWQSFRVPGSSELSHIAIDRNGYKWIANTRSGLLVFDQGEYDVDGDEQYYTLNSANAELGSSNIRSLIADKNGSIWVGTDDGLSIFSCGSSVFQGQCLGNRPVINPDNFNGRLLENLQVSALAVDGANRKWAGTNEGLFLLSEDGLETLAYFTKDNSPLPDNEILSLSIDPIEGYVYIATPKGLVAYRGQATEGKRYADKNEILAFPNPVPADYQGEIGIRGFVSDVNIKITDVSGLLVYETQSLGGQLVWNGKDYNGRRVRSGVYLVFSVDTETASQRLATKIIVLN